MNIKLKSKRAYTLVELVVTVAILSIVAGMGIGIFAMVLNQYSTASVTEQEQQQAALIEDLILRNSRQCTDVYISNTDTAPLTTYGSSLTKGEYLSHSTSTVNLESYSYKRNAAGTLTKEKDLTYKGVNKITFTLKRFDKEDYKQVSNPFPTASALNEPGEGYIYLEYLIEMNEGYTLDGAVVLNGVKLDSATGSALIDPSDATKFKDKTVVIEVGSSTALTNDQGAAKGGTIVFDKGTK